MPKAIGKSIGQRIKSIRNANNFSTNKFAEILGISQSSLTKLENDQAEPRTRTILAMHEKFAVDPLWLITGSASSVIQNQLALKVGQLVDTLPEAVQHLLLMLVEREVLLERKLQEERERMKSD